MPKSLRPTRGEGRWLCVGGVATRLTLLYASFGPCPHWPRTRENLKGAITRSSRANRLGRLPPGLRVLGAHRQPEKVGYHRVLLAKSAEVDGPRPTIGHRRPRARGHFGERGPYGKLKVSRQKHAHPPARLRGPRDELLVLGQLGVSQQLLQTALSARGDQLQNDSASRAARELTIRPISGGPKAARSAPISARPSDGGKPRRKTFCARAAETPRPSAKRSSPVSSRQSPASNTDGGASKAT